MSTAVKEHIRGIRDSIPAGTMLCRMNTSTNGPPRAHAMYDVATNLAGQTPFTGSFDPIGAAAAITATKDQANGIAGLNAQTRTTKGVDTTDDVIIDLATKGLVLKDTQATPHYWRVTISVLGVLTTADIGTVKP